MAWVILPIAAINGEYGFALFDLLLIVLINEIVPYNQVYNSIFEFCWIYPFCNKAARLNEGGQT